MIQKWIIYKVKVPYCSNLEVITVKLRCVFIQYPFFTNVQNLRMKCFIPKIYITHVSCEAKPTFVNPFSSLRNRIFPLPSGYLLPASWCSCVTASFWSLQKGLHAICIYFTCFFHLTGLRFIHVDMWCCNYSLSYESVSYVFPFPFSVDSV